MNKQMRPNETVKNGVCWYDPRMQPFQVSGLAWFQTEQRWRRMPANPVCPLPEAVDRLANHTAGAQIRFQTDSSSLAVRVKLSAKANMDHMPSTGQCGVDCYVGTIGKLQYCNTARYDITQTEYESILFENRERKMQYVVLNLPLYQGIESIEIGLEEEAKAAAPPAYDSNKKVIIYGTSITQGGCASRPGMAYSNILSRSLPLEFINLGFSGNGKGEPEVAKSIAEIEDPACLVLDYEANCRAGILEATLPSFIRLYRQKHPTVPILVVSKIRYAKETYLSQAAKDRLKRKGFQEELVRELRTQGDKYIHFCDGSTLLGEEDFHECTVDGVHPTDLGFMRMAEGLTPVLKGILSN